MIIQCACGLSIFSNGGSVIQPVAIGEYIYTDELFTLYFRLVKEEEEIQETEAKDEETDIQV